jgi:hypothetical protein
MMKESKHVYLTDQEKMQVLGQDFKDKKNT